MARKTPLPPKNFEEALQELEKILGDLESGQVGLEESLTRYERGSFLIRYCRDVLASAEKQIEQLLKDEQGQPQVAPLDDADEA